jgi:hypothetical protein
MRLLRLTLVVPLAMTAVGCLNLQTIVKVKPDGSGTLHQTLTMNPQAMEGMMEAMAAQMGGKVTKSEKPSGGKVEKKTVPGTSEAEARAKAAEFGEGVTFTSVVPIEKPDAMGATLNFAFKDVNKLRINPKPDKPGKAMGAPGASEKPEDRLQFRFAKAQSGNPQLTVVMGDMKREGTKPAATPAPAAGSEEMAMMKQMFKGMRILMAVDVEGKVVKTNSPYAEGNRVTILDIDLDKLLANPDVKSLDPIFEGSLDDARKALKGVKGIKMNLEPEVQIEFAK